MKRKTIYQKLWGAIQAVLKGKFITLNLYINKEGSCINSLSSYLKNRKKNRVNKKQAQERKIIKINVEINKIGKAETQ